MQTYSQADVLITGLGVVTGIGQGKGAFIDALLSGAHAFDRLKRPGRLSDGAFLGAEISQLALPAELEIRGHSLSFSAQAALATISEAWSEAALGEIDPNRIGLIVGGSNIQQRELTLMHEAYASRPFFIRPSYAMSFMDTDLCGICTEQFGIRGFAYTIGAASASGQVASIHAARSVASGEADVCIALGALMDLSHWECQSLRTLGAMGSDQFAAKPEQACRPFDRDRDGFIYGEACAAIVFENAESAEHRRRPSYGRVRGWSTGVDAVRNPKPSAEGEAHVMRQALRNAGLRPCDIDYINPHGSGSVIGDEVELHALQECDLRHAAINATKSLTGHGLTAAGAVEIVATLLQMQAETLHPNRNLDNPIDRSFNWVGARATPHKMTHALCLSYGFSGINSAFCVSKH